MKRNNLFLIESSRIRTLLFWVLLSLTSSTTTSVLLFCTPNLLPVAASTTSNNYKTEKRNQNDDESFATEDIPRSPETKIYEKLAISSLDIESGARLKNIVNVLDKADNVASSLSNFLTKHITLCEFAVGTYLLLYGGSFVHLMLFVHAISINSDTLNDSFNTLIQSYQVSRQNLKKNLPELLDQIDKEKNSLTSLKKSIEDHQSSLKKAITSFESSQVTKEQFHRQAKKHMKEIELLSNKLQNLYASHRVFSHIKEAIDPSHFKQALQSIYHTLLLGIGALRSHMIATLAMGLNMGKMVFHRLQSLLPHHYGFISMHDKSTSKKIFGKAEVIDAKSASIDEEDIFMKNVDFYLNDGMPLGYSTLTTSSSSSKWIKQIMKWTFQILGVSLAYTTRHIVNLLSAVSYGSHLIVNAIESSIKKLVAVVPHARIKRFTLQIPKPMLITTIQIMLIYIGVRIQAPDFFKDKNIGPVARQVLAFIKIDTKGTSTKRMPLWLSIISSPLFFMEKLLAKKSKRDVFSL